MAGPFYCVTWPKIGTGRNRRFFKNKREAGAFLHSKQIERENYGTAGTSFTERRRAEYMECAEALRPFNATIRQAVNFCLPHLHASNRACSAAQLVDELLKIKEADGASERYLDAIGRSKAHTKLERISSKNMNERFEGVV